MRILFFGSGEFAIPSFESLQRDGHDIVGVVTQPDKPRGRGKMPSPTPIKAIAQKTGRPVFDPVDVNTPSIASELKSLSAELACVVAFGQKIGHALLAAFPIGMINLHGSLLPALRGAAPIQWSIINGDSTAGVTVFRIVEKMDAGPIISQCRTTIGPDETAGELHDRLALLGCDAVRDALNRLQADPALPGTPQDPDRVTYARKLKKVDGFIRFDQPASSLAHLICGLWSWPGARCRFKSAADNRDEIVILARATCAPQQQLPGTSPVRVGEMTDRLGIQTIDGELALLQIKPAGGRLMSWQDYVNGRHVQPGDRFSPLDPAEVQ